MSPAQSASEKPQSGNRRSINIEKQSQERDPYNDCPEEIEPEIWERLLEARTRKILKEEEVKKMTDIMNEMTEHLNQLSTQDEINRKRIEKSLRDLAEFRENRERKRRNLALILHIKQGLVEVELKPLDGDYNDVALLPRSLIKDFNDAIINEASIKIKILVGLKDFKRSIYEVQYEIERLHLLEKVLSEKIRYIQLLRNTKGLQALLTSGEDVTLGVESGSLEKRLEHNKKLHDKKIAEKCTYLRQLERRAESVREQNGKYQQEASVLYQEFMFENRLCSKSMGDESNAAALQAKMRSLLTRRQLREQVKTQAEQIQQLEEGLDKVRKRTLPILPCGGADNL